MKNVYAYFWIAFSLIVLSSIGNGKVMAQTSVVIPGTFQNELGCTPNSSNYLGDWDPSCESTALSFNAATGLWTGTFKIPAGCQQYKVAIDGSWSVNYGENGVQGGANINLYVPEETDITFTYYPWSHQVITSPIASGFSASCLPLVVLAGSFQSETGCATDWDAACSNTALAYNAGSGLFEGDFAIPAGCYEYRVVLNNDWVNNFGRYGNIADPNYILSVPGKTTNVHFTYDPQSHMVNSIYNAGSCQPNTVVLAGSFQSELGCSSDWQANCDNTRLTYDPYSGSWTDTLYISAGSWQYKVTINDSWNENYGQNGVLNGDNILLDLCYPAKVVFRYYHSDYYHYVYSQVITNGICVNKFYDANVNGYPDFGEQPMAGVQFLLSGDGVSQAQTTGADGKAAFSNLPDGMYTVQENVPAGYIATVAPQQVYLSGNAATANFGNVCLGPGGAKGIGYWMSKNGEAALTNAYKMEDALMWLRIFYLKDAGGNDFDPYTYNQLKLWLQGASAKNMAYMLSAQMAAMFLNIEMNYVDNWRIVYTPDCGLMGNNNFSYLYSLIWNTNYSLLYNYNSTASAQVRRQMECLKNALDNANSNLTFVQLQPCTTLTTAARNTKEPAIISTGKEAIVWPNPSGGYFTLRPNANAGNIVQIRVLDVNGKQVHTARGNAAKDYRFGDRFTPGIYLLELTQGDEVKTFKLVKQ